MQIIGKPQEKSTHTLCCCWWWCCAYLWRHSHRQS